MEAVRFSYRFVQPSIRLSQMSMSCHAIMSLQEQSGHFLLFIGILDFYHNTLNVA